MKKLFVSQVFNPEYVGPDHTPDIDVHRYQVDKVLNSVTPQVYDYFTVAELQVFCDSDAWEVTVT